MKKFIRKTKVLSLLAFKVFLSFCVAYTLCLLGQEFLSYGAFAFVFLLLSLGSGFFYLISPYKWTGTLTLTLILIAFSIFLNWYVSFSYSA